MAGTQYTSRLTVARRRRIFTVFPCTESAVDGKRLASGGFTTRPRLPPVSKLACDFYCRKMVKNLSGPGLLTANGDARPAHGPRLHFERRFKHVLEQVFLEHRGGRAHPQALAAMKENDLVGKFCR